MATLSVTSGRGKSLVLLAALVLACAQPAPEVEAPVEPRPPVETRSRVDRAIATTGDVITYTVTVDYEPAYEIEVPEMGAEIAGFRIVDVGNEKPRELGGRRVEERWYQLRADLVGSYVLPPVEVTYRLKEPDGTESAAGDGAEREPASVRTSEIFVEVQSVLPAGGEVSDIRGLKPLRKVEPSTPWWLFAAGGTAAALLAVLGFALWRRSHRRFEAPPRPAHEIAFEALERLRGTDFADRQAVRRFHFEISEVIRAYVEARFALNATDLTTEEIVAHLGEVRGLDGGSEERLRRFLAATDRVKFAARVASEAEIEETYDDALSFVEATREQPAEAPDAASADEPAPLEAAA